MTTTQIDKLTAILSDIITEAEMKDENTCRCCLPLVSIEISESTLEDLIEIIEPKLLPFLRARLQTVYRTF